MTNRCVALVALLLANGCLFVGDVNDRPRVQLEALTTGTTLGTPISLNAFIDDDQGDATLTVVVRDENDVVVDDPCVAGLSSTGVGGSVAPSYTLLFWKSGTYTVDATPTDRYGASGSSASVIVNVYDGPPSFSVDDSPSPAIAASVCTSNYPTGIVIPVRFDGIVLDPEQSWRPPPPQCANQAPSPIARTWHILAHPAGDGTGTLGRAVGGACPTTPTDAAIDLADDDPLVCLYPSTTLPTGVPSTYVLGLDVSDGTTTVHSQQLSLNVVGNTPSCLSGMYPDAGSYVLDRGAPTVFQAVGVDDVATAASLALTWSIERAGDTSYTALGPATSAADGGGRLVFDPSALGLAVGDHVKLRVEIDDPANPAAACDDDDDVCTITSCAVLPDLSCPRRAKWDLEIR